MVEENLSREERPKEKQFKIEPCHLTLSKQRGKEDFKAHKYL
jgi:hypothetical protein